MKIATKFLLFTLLFCHFANAQDAKKSIERLKSQTNASVTVSEQTGFAEFVRFPVGNAMSLNGASVQQKAFSFLQNYKAIYNMESVDGNLVFDKVQTDNYGLKNVILKQVYKGVPVFDGQLRFHFNSDKKLISINGNYMSGISKLNPVPTITSGKAGAIAMNVVKNQDLNGSGQPLLINSNTLNVFPKGLVQGYVTSIDLVFEVEVVNKVDVREFIYVDAHTGEIVEQFTGMAHALNRKLYENNVGNLIWQEGDAYPGTLNLPQRNLVQSSGQVYNFFKNAFGFVSYDNADGQMRSINNSPSINCATSTNANWNGFSANYCDGSAADDVVAHEWGHAYTQYTSGLIYSYQSGAINESYSDIWGETVDLLNNYEDTGENLNIRTSASCFSQRWKIGEKATGFSGPIRDMWNPNCNGDPAKVTDNGYSCGDFDSGGVHINSGIPNHAYALLVDGGTFNGQIINGIGFVKAAHIFWRAQSVYLTQFSDFANLADALEAACNDLVGVNLQGLSTTGSPAGLSGQMITLTDCQDVARAILAVELRINPEICGYAPLLALTVPLCEASTSNPLFFENWEADITGWTFSQLPSNVTTWEPRTWAINSSLPNERIGKAIFATDPINGDCESDFQNGIIRMESPMISIPNITTGRFDMAFTHYVATEAKWDGGNIKYSIDGGEWTLVPSSAFLANSYNRFLDNTSDNDNPLKGQPAFSGSDGGSNYGSWGQSVINLSALGVTANSNIQFRFELGTDGCNGNDGWYIDEIVIYNCSATLSVAEVNSIESGLKIYPNPSNGLVMIKKLKDIELLKAEVFDINGRSVKTIDLTNMENEKQIDITDVASGVYFMSLTSKDAKSVIKLIKQ